MRNAKLFEVICISIGYYWNHCEALCVKRVFTPRLVSTRGVGYVGYVGVAVVSRCLVTLLGAGLTSPRENKHPKHVCWGQSWLTWQCYLVITVTGCWNYLSLMVRRSLVGWPSSSLHLAWAALLTWPFRKRKSFPDSWYSPQLFQRGFPDKITNLQSDRDRNQ